MSVAPDWPLATERLVLRPFEEADFDDFLAMRSDAEVSRYLYTDPLTRDEARDLLRRKIAGDRIVEENEWLSAAAVLRTTGELAADVVLKLTSAEHLQGEIGFSVMPTHQGQGYAAEAARPVVDFGFRTLGLHRVVGRLDARNAASARVLEKLGMRREALFVENEWVKGEWQSELVYALLADERVAAG